MNCRVGRQFNLNSFTREVRLVSNLNVEAKINEIESVIQIDPGQRGISTFIPPLGELYQSARSLMRLDGTRRDAAVITGFPCLLDFSPPTETDGPLGAVAIAQAYIAATAVSSFHVLTDECNADVMDAALTQAGLRHHPRIKFKAFPPMFKWTFEDREYLNQIASRISTTVAIERAGPGQDGGSYTMGGRNMSHLLAPLHELMELGNSDDMEFESIGIGDGGNEVGMGKVWERIQTSTIPDPSKVACVVPADHLVVCGISNWGGTALAAAITLLHATKYSESMAELNECWARGMFDDTEEFNILKAMVNAGARDGCTKEQVRSVDGLLFEEYLRVNQAIRTISLSVQDS